MRRAGLLVVCGTMLAEAQMGTHTSAEMSCDTQVEYDRYVGRLAANCCDQYGQEDNCVSGAPEICDTRCAPVFMAFWTACQDYVATSVRSPAIRQQFTAVNGRCHATLQANEVHDTDLITPGEQHDMNTPLAVPVNCNQERLKTAAALDHNSGPLDSIWMVGIKGDSSCLYEKTETSMGGYTTQAEHDNCPVLVNKHRVIDLLVARYGECVEHRPPPPPPPGESGHDLVQPRIDVISSGGVAGHSTYQLSLKFQAGSDQGAVSNLYALYGAPAVTVGPSAGEPAHIMRFPPAYQEPAPFGADIGGTNPMFWNYAATAEFDSWLAIGDISGTASADVSSVGIDFDGWDDTNGITVDNGAVFWMDPTKAPSTDPCVIAQVTVRDGVAWSAIVNARGKLGDYSGGAGDDWEATNLVFSDADVPAQEGEGQGGGYMGGGHRRRVQKQVGPVGPPDVTAPGEGDMPSMVCDFSMDTNLDGAVGEGDYEWNDLSFFGAILSKDAVFYLATDSVAAPLIDYIECDEAVGGRRQLSDTESAASEGASADVGYPLLAGDGGR